jgi:hypothetical protein
MGELRLVEESEPIGVDGVVQFVGRADDKPTGGHERRGIAFEGLTDRGRLRRFSHRMVARGVRHDRPADGRAAVCDLARDVDQAMLVRGGEHLVHAVNDSRERRDEGAEAPQRF